MIRRNFSTSDSEAANSNERSKHSPQSWYSEFVQYGFNDTLVAID
jgi:hypothetical protein